MKRYQLRGIISGIQLSNMGKRRAKKTMGWLAENCVVRSNSDAWIIYAKLTPENVHITREKAGITIRNNAVRLTENIRKNSALLSRVRNAQSR